MPGTGDTRSVREQFRGYAFTKIKAQRDSMVRDFERDKERGKFTKPEMEERAEARIASFDDLIAALEAIKAAIK
jgi:hypothetical protein